MPNALEERLVESRELFPLRHEVAALRTNVVAHGAERYRGWRPRLTRRSFRPSALNLAAYIALRRHDLRGLQTG